ncbi:hypothetical protein RDWZM_001059 [Blomia tropicalis]|uniref:rhomboid protease n=1 Tax=Blomia tropicalis TaxID=40697 RepID=A0A9Q0MBR1_BLOTA|nr:hypothetical protein RDWZM_001059 [Blomia tropicalis]
MLPKFTNWSLKLSKFTSKFPIGRVGFHNQQNELSPFQARNLLKPFVFTLSVCGSSFVVATIWRYENQRSDFRSFLSITNSGIQKIQRRYQKEDDYIQQIKQWWNSQSDGFKMFCGITAINTLVFFGWRIPQLQTRIMTKYFMASVEQKSIRCLPMILSNFSHYSPMHFGLNMFVLYSFANIGVHIMGKENFLALYLSSGVMSSFVSSCYKVAVKSLTPSLGASGAILGILASTCIERPDIELMIIFLPFFSFSSATALKGLILMDTAGLIFRWGFFDHAAHLGGTLFGVYYSTILKQYLNRKQSVIIKHWVDLKQKF